jgi:ATP-dependent Clp protease protease subunit
MSKLFSRIIPSVTDESDGVSRSYDIYSRLLKDRIIMLHGPIDEMSSATTVMQLLVLEAENKDKPIYIYINSPGGCVYSCFSILDTMKCVKCPVATVSLGLVASAAAVILSCGTRGMRFALPNTRIMIHQPHGGAKGQVTDIEIQTKEFLFLKNKINDIMADRAKISITKIKQLMERDKYLSAEEALELGLIDRILKGDFDDKKSLLKIT